METIKIKINITDAIEIPKIKVEVENLYKQLFLWSFSSKYFLKFFKS